MRARLGLAIVVALLAGGCGLQPPERPASGEGAVTPVPGAPIPAAPSPSPTPSASPGGGPAPTSAGLPPPFPGYALAWADEFDGTAVEPSRWRVASGARRDAVNTPAALSVNGGALRVAVTTVAGVHQTGMVSSEGAFAATYGYYEARIRFTSAPGEWCAFWLMSPTIGVPLGDPGTAGAEIDVVEHRFTDDNGWQLKDQVSMNLNWDGYGVQLQRVQHVTPLPGNAPVQGQWHVFGVLWEPASYTFYVDGTPLFRTTQAVSHRSEFIQLSCEVEDRNGWAGAIPAGGYPAAAGIGMEVDWVRAWKAP